MSNPKWKITGYLMDDDGILKVNISKNGIPAEEISPEARSLHLCAEDIVKIVDMAKAEEIKVTSWGGMWPDKDYVT